MAYTDSTGFWPLFDAAQAHGNQGEPDHEVGDLQEVVIQAWWIMTPEQRAKVGGKCSDLLRWLD